MFRRRDNPNAFFGIILLIMLLVFVGPTFLPELLSESISFVDAGAPCQQLRSANNRAQHQSLIGRLVEDPLELTVQADPVQNGILVIRVNIQNNSLGTVPIIYNENDVIINDDGSNGLGITLNPPATGGQITRQFPSTGTIPETNIKLLGPRQRCVHRFEINAGILSPNISNGNGTVTAFYRINTEGTVQQVNPAATPIFPDQGLDILVTGLVQSPPVVIPPPTFNAQ